MGVKRTPSKIWVGHLPVLMWADKDLHPIQYFQLLTYSSSSGNGKSVNRILEIGLPGFSKLTSLLAYCVTWKPPSAHSSSAL